jgi:hypothetical protein
MLSPPALPESQPGKYYLKKAKEQPEEFYRLIQLVFQQNRYPEQLYRSCDGLFRLQRKTQPETFDKACSIAIDCQSYSYKFIQNILENKMTQQQQEAKAQSLPVHENIRGKDYYSTSTLNI